MAIRMRSFHFERPVGEGMPLLSVVTAQGVEFGNGRVVVQWLDDDNPALMAFDNLHAMRDSLADHVIYWDEETRYHASHDAS
ncbi:MAG TPA: hypothetical protein VFV89_03395 [Nocardioides sp.]|uniref:hypothetical protein n=1 Tax=Nocardioides sp. TaxID=35761 RepID=UPI002E30B336|nr:hypothetical protein [Nocardioides sp.]HEX5086826.1 hypothetical protein [Nocardioides sp.]